MHRLDEMDFYNLDLRSLPPKQWDALVQQGIRRAHAERSRMFHKLLGQLWAWIRRAAQRLMALGLRPPRNLISEKGVLS